MSATHGQSWQDWRKTCRKLEFTFKVSPIYSSFNASANEYKIL